MNASDAKLLGYLRRYRVFLTRDAGVETSLPTQVLRRFARRFAVPKVTAWLKSEHLF